MRWLYTAYITAVLTAVASSADAQVTRLSNNTNIQYGVQANGKFILTDAAGFLWTTNGTAGGTSIYTTKAVYDSSGGFGVYNNKVYFSGNTVANGIELWVTDGTDAGTSMVKNISSGSASSTPSDFYVFNNTLFFTATDATNGKELWKTDGTAGGTVLVKDINSGSADGITTPMFFANNNILFFTANDGTNGTELWKTDGTSAGTVLVKDVVTGSGSPTFESFAALGTKTIFSAVKGAIGTGNFQLWVTDGTTAGTTLLKDFGSFSTGVAGFLNFNNMLFFGAGPIISGKGVELWSTDGTSAGTTMVKDINSGLNSSFPILFNAVIINSKFYFAASTNANGLELWESDGTGTGTTLFMDIDPGTASSIPLILPVYNYSGSNQLFNPSQLYNGKIFFIADDGTHGKEPWTTDGTTTNTALVKDINAGSATSLDSLSSWYYTTLGMYFSANDGTNGNELWKSDGTGAGTTLVKNINAGSASSAPILIGIYNNHLYFTCDDGDNINGDRDLYIVDASLGTLPLQLLNFTAALAGQSAHINWTSANEKNSNYFTVQRSVNAVDFQSIGTVASKATNSGTFQYSFADNDVYKTGATIVYYRLAMTDKDGSMRYSQVVPLTLNKFSGSIQVYPNPVQKQLYVLFNTENTSTATLRITNADGKIVYNRALANNGNQSISVPVASFSAGTYYVQLITDKGTQTTRFIKE